jgi:GNAT superfamily N-acetyltransferase
MQDEHLALEEIESAAMADFYRAAPDELRRRFQIEARETLDATLLMSRGMEPGVLFRRVNGLGTRRPATQSALTAALTPMSALGGAFAIAVVADCDPDALPEWLQGHGFTLVSSWMKFRRACAGAPDVATDLQVRVVGPESAAAFGGVVRDGFALQPAFADWSARLVGRPGWCCVMAFDKHAPVAAGAAYVKGAYAGLGFGATLESHRRRGAQSALLSQRLREAAARGARVAAVETGERVPDRPNNSYRNILRCGFSEVYLRRNYMSPPP